MLKINVELKFLALAAIFLGFAGDARAVMVTGSGTVQGYSVSASADFEISGNTLTITLTNTSSGNPQETPTNTLTGIEFTFQNTKLALTPASAISPNAIFDLAACSAPAKCTGLNIDVGGEWGFDNGSFAPHADAIGSAGYITTGLAHDIGNFEPGGAAGSDLDGTASLGGIGFGIVSKNAGAFNGGLSGRPLIQDAVVLTLNGVNGDLTNPGSLTSVTFLYGTSPDGTLTGTCSGSCAVISNSAGGAAPEPATLGIFGTALLGLTAAMRRPQQP